VMSQEIADVRTHIPSVRPSLAFSLMCRFRDRLVALGGSSTRSRTIPRRIMALRCQLSHGRPDHRVAHRPYGASSNAAARKPRNGSLERSGIGYIIRATVGLHVSKAAFWSRRRG